MSFDGLVLRAIQEELTSKITGGRVDKIYQQDNKEILINIRNYGQNYKLMLSASGNNPRLHFTNIVGENPKVPPAFCMLLRKHLEGSKILSIFQYKMDRILKINFLSKNELGDDVGKSLIVEVMGKHSNIILTNSFDNKIIDSIKRINVTMSRVREVLPGIIYSEEPVSTKENPLNINPQQFTHIFERAEKRLSIKKFLMDNFTGISPLISTEISFMASLDEKRPISSLDKEEVNKLNDSFFDLTKLVKDNKFKPTLVIGDDKSLKAYSAIDLRQFQYEKKTYFESISELIDYYFSETESFDRLLQKTQHLRKSVKNYLDRALSKQSALNQDLDEALDREKYKIYADLISANIYTIEKGASEKELVNFYSETSEHILVPLDIKLSPSQNAQKYYKKYTKLKNASKMIQQQLVENREDIEYLQSIIYTLESCNTVGEIEDIRMELVEQSYLKNKVQGNKKSKVHKVSYSAYKTYDGHTIYIGKNNKQNEKLTLKDASKDDLWFHVKNAPGSHVLVKNIGVDFSQEVIETAANLAAINSAISQSENIEVDYTLRKNIKRHPSKKPGLVIYDNFKTINIRPNKNIIDQLEKI